MAGCSQEVTGMKWRARVPLIAVVGGLACLLESVGCDQLARAANRGRNSPKAFFIVAPDKLRPALTEYVAYKSKFRPTTLVSLERVLESTEGVDDPERLKRFLYNAWQQQHLGYVLLVGDPDVMPVRYMVLDRINEAAFDYAFYPSDLYYADLAKRDGSFENWNAEHKGFHAGYFGEVRGEKNKRSPINYDRVDYLPEIAFGRWPVSTEKDVRVVAAKSMAFEQSIREGTHAGLGRAAFFHVECGDDNRERVSGWAQKLPPGWQASQFLYKDKNADYGTPAPDEAHAIETLNQGAVLALHVGHGWEGGWAGSLSAPGGSAQGRGSPAGADLGGLQHSRFRPIGPIFPLRRRQRRRARRDEQKGAIPCAPSAAGTLPAGEIDPQQFRQAGTQMRTQRRRRLHRVQYGRPVSRGTAHGRFRGGHATLKAAAGRRLLGQCRLLLLPPGKACRTGSR